MRPFDELAGLVRARYALLYLLTHEEHRAESALRAAARDEGALLYRWRPTSGLLDPEGEPVDGTRELLAALDHLLRLPQPAWFVLHDFHRALEDPLVVRRLRDLEPILADRRQAVIGVSPLLVLPPELEKDLTVLEVPLPDAEELGTLLDDIAAQASLRVEPQTREALVRAALGLTANEVRRVFTRLRNAGHRFTEEDVSLVVAEKRRAIRKSRYLEFQDVTEPLENVGGMDNLKAWLQERAAAFTPEARAFGLPAPKGLFLLGVQGCGKSLMAKAVANLWRVPLLRLDVGAVFQQAAHAELGLRDTVRVAESLAPVVLWIDELEKGFLATRDQGGGRALGTFLTWMQEKTSPVFVVATANDVRLLPPELLRKGRFDEIFFVDLPNVHERLAILEIHLRRRGRDPEAYDLTSLSEETERFSGAELEQVVVSGLFRAFAEGRELRDEDLQLAAQEMVPLAVTMDDQLKALREWARPRARRASLDTRRVDFFEEWEAFSGP